MKVVVQSFHISIWFPKQKNVGIPTNVDISIRKVTGNTPKYTMGITMSDISKMYTFVENKEKSWLGLTKDLVNIKVLFINMVK